jgi:hypothetical protein
MLRQIHQPRKRTPERDFVLDAFKLFSLYFRQKLFNRLRGFEP